MSLQFPQAGGKIPNFTVFTIRNEIFLPSSKIRGLIPKLTPIFFLKWIWGRKVLLYFLHSISKVLPFVISPQKFVNSYLVLLSKNLKITITQAAIDGIFFKAHFVFTWE